jgi:hypothetical protein
VNILNSSYIPIGGALLLSLRRDRKSLPFCPETKVFVDKYFADSLGLTDKDFLYVVSWNERNSFVQTEDNRVVVCPNYKIGIQDINRLKTLISLWNKKIRLNTAISMISMWSDGVPFFSIQENKFIDQQEKWMRTDKKIDLFLDLEAQSLGTTKLSLDQKEDIRSFLIEIQNKDIGLYKVAAQVDSMPKVLNTKKHLAFMPEELSIIERVI